MGSVLSGWMEMAGALAAFFATHAVPARPKIRGFLVGRLGKRAYLAVYSLLSLAVLAWLIDAAARAPYLALWDFELWQLWVPSVVMPLVCLLVAFGIGAPSPFSLGGRDAAGFDPDRPGIAGITRHPLLWALTLWALAHMVPNGDLAHVLLFGLFAVFGLVGMVALDARQRRRWGEELWAQRAKATSLVPFGAVFSGRFRGGGLSDRALARGLAALLLYIVFLALHRPLIGVLPLPPV